MEDWQEWQIRADKIAADLGKEVDDLESSLSAEAVGLAVRGFWPRFRSLKERVRTAPAIKLDDKLRLERRLRDVGSRAYKAQEAVFARSTERKDQILASIAELRGSAEASESPRQLRDFRRDLDGVRKEFDAETLLAPSDRQALWDAWREASQFVWQRLTSIWEENEQHLRELLTEGRRQLEVKDAEAARQSVGKFFDALRTREGRQNAVTELKSDANAIRNESHRLEERRAAERLASRQTQNVPPLEGWKSELEHNRETAGRLAEEVDALDRQFRETRSVLEQAMLRGTLVEKKRKLAEIERSNRTLEQRIDQAEDSPQLTAI